MDYPQAGAAHFFALLPRTILAVVMIARTTHPHGRFHAIRATDSWGGGARWGPTGMGAKTFGASDKTSMVNSFNSSKLLRGLFGQPLPLRIP